MYMSLVLLGIATTGIFIGTWWLWAPLIPWFSYLVYKSWEVQ